MSRSRTSSVAEDRKPNRTSSVSEDGMLRSRTSSIAEDRISFISAESIPTRPILTGDIGRGFNILTGSPTEFLFQTLPVQCAAGKAESVERFYSFKDAQEFRREEVNRVGLNTVEKGMFSMCNIQSKTPFLCEIDNAIGSQHFLMEIERLSYLLSIDESPPVSKFFKNEKKKLKGNPFSKQSKSIYYSVIEKLGTHYVKQVTFGNKAEMMWTVRVKSDADTFSKITKNQHQKQKFEDSFQIWKQTNFDTVGESYKKVKKNAPKNSNIEMKVTPGFTNPTLNNPVQIGFVLAPIYTLFDESLRKDFELAVRLYLEEMRPKSDIEDFREDEIVGLYCLDTSTWIRVDDHGHLFADGTILGPEHKFEVRRKGTKIGLKSLKFQNKYISKALMRSIFHFHRLQYMGPYESFEVNGSFMIVGANIADNAGFLYIGDGNQIQVSDSKKTRILIVNAEVRNSTILAPEEVSEPHYVEDESVILAEISDVPPALKDIPKANSTSSLFIKDTIILPNIDELTRCMALYLSVLIKEGHAASKLNILDIFNEDIHPLTKNVPKLQNMKIPPMETIFHFLNTIFKVEKLSPEPGIMALVYIERILEKTHMHLHAASWRRLVLASLIVASKVWEDQSVWTVDFLELFPSANIKDLNRLEQHLLAILDFSVSIKASDYVKHYFELRAYMKSDFSQRGGKPLDHEALHKLEIRSASSEEDFKAPFRMMRSATSTQLIENKKKHGLGVLS